MAEYSHADGGCAITGIGVYRGDAFPSLDGTHFNSDWCSGKVWGLARDEARAWVYEELLDTELNVTGGGADEAGNLYLTACVCAFNRRYDPFANPLGTVWRLVAAGRVPPGAETAPLTPVDAEAPPNAEATLPEGEPTASASDRAP